MNLRAQFAVAREAAAAEGTSIESVLAATAALPVPGQRPGA